MAGAAYSSDEARATGDERVARGTRAHFFFFSRETSWYEAGRGGGGYCFVPEGLKTGFLYGILRSPVSDCISKHYKPDVTPEMLLAFLKN